MRDAAHFFGEASRVASRARAHLISHVNETVAPWLSDLTVIRYNRFNSRDRSNIETTQRLAERISSDKHAIYVEQDAALQSPTISDPIIAKMVYSDRLHSLDSKLAESQKDTAEYRTQFWTREAARYSVPLPKKTDEDMWEQMSGTDVLTTSGVYAIRTLVRKERRDRWESVAIRIALVLSILTLALGVLNFIISAKK
jgi:hypothetical protein